MYNNKKKIVIIVMCIAIFVMITGYSLLSTRLNIRGTSNLTDTWGIKISNVTYTATGRAYNIEEPTYTDTNMTFNVGVKEPGDKMVFDVTVTNYGTLDAILEKIDATTSGSHLIIYSITGIEEQSRLKAGTSLTFQVTTEFDINAITLPNNSNKTLNIDLHYVQDDGQTLTPSDPNIKNKALLVQEILSDNIAQPDTNIDFSQISSDTNGKGLYYTNTNTEDNKTTYYFRGAVENNYVSFANNTWRIVRINEDGSVRLIKQDVIGTSVFNTNYDDAAYVGYMYGTAGSSTYEATNRNTNSSTIKTALDTWYQNNLINYSSIIADSGFCGDRSLSSGTGIGTTNTNYGAYNRLYTNKTPQFKCPQTNDLYTTATSTKGNKALDYPIGLITADEVAYAGGGYNEENKSCYLVNGDYFWTMSPFSFNYFSVGRVWGVYPDGNLDVFVVNGYGVRPAINLKSTAEITSGDGTISNPYVIKVN